MIEKVVCTKCGSNDIIKLKKKNVYLCLEYYKAIKFARSFIKI